MHHRQTPRQRGFFVPLALLLVLGCGEDVAEDRQTVEEHGRQTPAEDVSPTTNAEAADPPHPADRPPEEPAFTYSPDLIPRAVEGVGRKTNAEMMAWARGVRAGRTIRFVSDESRNVARVAEEAVLADATLRMLTASAVLEADGEADLRSRLEALTVFLLDFDELFGAPADAVAGRFHVVRAKIAFLDALERQLRSPTGLASAADGDDPRLKILEAMVKEAVDTMCQGFADVAAEQRKRQVNRLPAGWESEEPDDAGPFEVVLKTAAIPNM